MQAGIEPTVFATTRWSLIVAGTQFREGEQQSRDALAELCVPIGGRSSPSFPGVAIHTKTRRI